MKDVLFRFLRSPLGLALWGFCALSAAALALSGVLHPIAAVLVALTVGVLATAGLLMSPAGAKSVVAERDRDRAEADARALEAVAAARKRLSLLAVENAAVKAEIDRLVFAAGKYLESAVKGGRRDPVAEEAVAGAVAVVHDYLIVADAAASAARGRTAGSGRPDEALERTLRALAAAVEEVEGRSSAVSDAADRASAREELL